LYANIIHQNHTTVLQLSYREIFIFLNIPTNDLTGSFKGITEDDIYMGL